jgi:hypothetical protein
MSRAHLSITTLALITAFPLAWLACGGGSKPPESPAEEKSSAASSSESTSASESPSPAASASSAPAASETAAAASPAPESTASSAPPPPSFGNTDCGKCVDKTCAKQAAACGKDSDCQATLDTIHGCSQSGAACVDAATAPTAKKAKQLATAYETCAKKAATAKTCKAKCQ